MLERLLSLTLKKMMHVLRLLLEFVKDDGERLKFWQLRSLNITILRQL